MSKSIDTSNTEAKMSGTGLKIIIVGGGIGGFTAGIALRRQGHKVELFEQSRFANEVGAAIHVTPNANSVLRRLDFRVEDTGAVLLTQTKLLKHSGEVLNVIDNTKTASRWQNQWMLAHRARLHRHLKELATSATEQGLPVKVHTSSKVVGVDSHTATATLRDGTQVRGDVLIGADGVHSVARVAMSKIQPFKSSHNAIRFMVTKEAASGAKLTRDLISTPGTMHMWYGPDRKIVLYPTSNNTLFNFVCIHPADLSETTGDYNQNASKKQLLDIYYDFEPAVVKMLEISDPDSIKVYPLYDMDTLPTYIDDRLALVGDAAHPFTPHLGQGGAMAIEDAVSLAVMLPGGTTAAQVPERLQLYNKARYERATTVQNNSRMTGNDGVQKDASTARFNLHEVMEHGLSHDEIHHSAQLFREDQWSRSPQTYWRQPTVFGPIPGPRQDYKGGPYSPHSPPSTVIATIKFKTSATLLRTLFPNSSYKLTSLDTVATASFCVQTLNNMPWLAGGSYDLFAFYIHNVQYTERSNKTHYGSFCPVLFENLTDPILSGREELGFPKLFSDIAIVDNGSMREGRISWRGAEWAKLSWNGLETHGGERTIAPDDANGDMGQQSHLGGNRTGLFVHKCIPASEIADRKQHRSDAEYDVHIPAYFGDSAEAKVRKAAHAEFKLSNLGFHKLPTIHHIVERLAEVPCFEIVEASVVETNSLPDLSDVRRLL